MLPAYFSASCLGGFPAYLSVYQQLQYLSRAYSDNSRLYSTCVSAFPSPFPPQTLVAMASPNADVSGLLTPSPPSLPVDPSSPVTSDPMTSPQPALARSVTSAVTEEGQRRVMAEGWNYRHHDDLHVNPQEVCQDRSTSATSPTSPTSVPSSCRLQASSAAVKFSIDSILGLSTHRSQHGQLTHSTQRSQHGQLTHNTPHRHCPHDEQDREKEDQTEDREGPGDTGLAVPHHGQSGLRTGAHGTPHHTHHTHHHTHHTHHNPHSLPEVLTNTASDHVSDDILARLPLISTPSAVITISDLHHNQHSTSPPLDPPHSHQQQVPYGNLSVDGGGEGVEVGELEIRGEERVVGACSDKDKMEEQTNYPWLQCTRYHPPKLQRSKKKDGGGKKRKLGRNPRVPFTQHQVAVLEEKFRRTHYLSSMDVAELSTALTLSETRFLQKKGSCKPPKAATFEADIFSQVKIWFQNRRARERREREASQRAQLLSQKPYQPLSIPSVTWALTSQLTPSPFTARFRNELPFRAGLFSSAFSAFTPPVRHDPASVTCSWTDTHNSDDDNQY